MENENKNASAPAQKQNPSGNHKKNRPQKHKPYYIEPAGEQSADAQKNAQAQKPQQKPEAKQDQPKNDGGNTNNAHQNKNHHSHNHHNRNHKKSTPQNQAQSAVAKTPEQQNAPVVEEQKAQNEHPAAKSHNRNRNRNRSHDKRREDNRSESSSSGEAFSDQLKPMESFSPAPKQNDKLQRPAPQKMSKFSESPEYSQYSDYEEFSVAELYGDAKEEPITVQNEDGTLSVIAPEAPEEPKVEVVGIRFKSSGKTYYFAPEGVSLRIGAHAIVETARGLEYGEVAIANTFVNESETVPPLRHVIRKATDADINMAEDYQNEAIHKTSFRKLQTVYDQIFANILLLHL